jgi:hypothetical protein
MAEIPCFICGGQNCELAAKSCMELVHSLESLKDQIDTHRVVLQYANELLQQNKGSPNNSDHVKMCFQNQTLLFTKRIEMQQRIEHIKHYKEGVDIQIESLTSHSSFIGGILETFEPRPTHVCPTNGSTASP